MEGNPLDPSPVTNTSPLFHSMVPFKAGFLVAYKSPASRFVSSMGCCPLARDSSVINQSSLFSHAHPLSSSFMADRVVLIHRLPDHVPETKVRKDFTLFGTVSGVVMTPEEPGYVKRL